MCVCVGGNSKGGGKRKESDHVGVAELLFFEVKLLFIVRTAASSLLCCCARASVVHDGSVGADLRNFNTHTHIHAQRRQDTNDC